MAGKRSPLRAVAPDEKPATPESPKVMTLAEAISGGKYLDILRAQRRDIVESLPNEKGPAKAALHRQLAGISKEIETLEAKERQAAKEDGEHAAIDDEAWDSEAL